MSFFLSAIRAKIDQRFSARRICRNANSCGKSTVFTTISASRSRVPAILLTVSGNKILPSVIDLVAIAMVNFASWPCASHQCKGDMVRFRPKLFPVVCERKLKIPILVRRTSWLVGIMGIPAIPTFLRIWKMFARSFTPAHDAARRIIFKALAQKRNRDMLPGSHERSSHPIVVRAAAGDAFALPARLGA